MTDVDLSEIRDKEAGVDLTRALTSENIGKSVADLDEPLVKLIEKHRQWVDSAGKNGLQLDITDIDMRELTTLKQQRLTAIQGRGAKFFGMNLYRVEMQRAHLEEADFRRCDLESADFRGAILEKARFNHANLQNTDFSSLVFGGDAKRFASAILDEAVFRYCDLRGANFKNASLKYADLSYTDLSGADFTGADMTGAILDKAKTDDAMMDKAKMDNVERGRAFSLSKLKANPDDDD